MSDAKQKTALALRRHERRIRESVRQIDKSIAPGTIVPRVPLETVSRGWVMIMPWVWVSHFFGQH